MAAISRKPVCRLPHTAAGESKLRLPNRVCCPVSRSGSSVNRSTERYRGDITAITPAHSSSLQPPPIDPGYTDSDDGSPTMASSPSRIPVSAQHSRIPVVLGSALPPIASSRMTSSSSMPSVALRSSGHASALVLPVPTTATPISTSPTLQDGTPGSGGSIAATSMWHNAIAEDRAWGKIERLRTRRVHSEGHNHASLSRSASSSSPPPPLAKPDRRQEIDHKLSPRRSSRHTPIEPLQLSGAPHPLGEISKMSLGRTHRLPDIRPDSGHADIPHQPVPGHPLDVQIASRSKSITRAVDDTRHRISRQDPAEISSALPGEMPGRPSVQAAQSEYAARTKLVSNDGALETGLLALGFGDLDKRPNRSAAHRSVDPSRREPQNLENRTTSTDHLDEPLRGDALRRLGDASTFIDNGQGHTPSKPSGIQIPRISPPSRDTVSNNSVNMDGRGYSSPNEIELNSPEMSISFGTKESDHNLSSMLNLNHTATTAQKRHQPQLRLASMPNVPMFHAPGIELASRSPGSGGSPPIPAKNPLRKRSSVGTATSGSQVSTPGLSSMSTLDTAYGSLAERSDRNLQDVPFHSSSPTVPPPRIGMQTGTHHLVSGNVSSPTVSVSSSCDNASCARTNINNWPFFRRESFTGCTYQASTRSTNRAVAGLVEFVYQHLALRGYS